MNAYNEYGLQLAIYNLLAEMAMQDTEVIDVEAMEVTEDEDGNTDNH